MRAVSLKRILVVDDDPGVRFLLRLLFESVGYEVSEAQHGVAALIRVKEALPDLVVTDIMMPIMDGSQLIKHLKSDERTAALPIVAITGTPGAKEAAAAADVVMTKPFDHSSLLATVGSLLVGPHLSAG
jgi:CheY-like chemotaxis protein